MRLIFFIAIILSTVSLANASYIPVFSGGLAPNETFENSYFSDVGRYGIVFRSNAIVTHDSPLFFYKDGVYSPFNATNCDNLYMNDWVFSSQSQYADVRCYNNTRTDLLDITPSQIYYDDQQINPTTPNYIYWVGQSPTYQNANYIGLRSYVSVQISQDIVGLSGSTSKNGSFLVTGVDGSYITFNYKSPFFISGTPPQRRDAITFTNLQNVLGGTKKNLTLLTSSLYGTPPQCSTTIPSGPGVGNLTYSPTSYMQAWIKDSNSCGYTCINGYTGDSCSIPPNSCSSTPPTGPGVGDLTYSPTSYMQAWIKDSNSCGYTCINGYTGDSCSIPPSPSTPDPPPTISTPGNGINDLLSDSVISAKTTGIFTKAVMFVLSLLYTVFNFVITVCTTPAIGGPIAGITIIFIAWRITVRKTSKTII